jgi:hypothetical protein
MRPWTEDPQAYSYLRSAVAVATFAVACEDLTNDHRQQLLNNAIWYVTESAGKYTTRYRSAGVLGLEAANPVRNWRAQLRHDHVVPRAALITAMREGADVEAVLASATSCVVTKAEHRRLSAYDGTHSGWDRYLAALVDVYDMATRTLVIDRGTYVNGGPRDAASCSPPGPEAESGTSSAG